MKRISVVFGTRPEAIKLCPLVSAVKGCEGLAAHVCSTGQHREMLDQVLRVFGVTTDVDLELMQTNQTLAGLASRAIIGLDGYLSEYEPDMVIVQGDTTTAFIAALAAYYHQIPVGHVEAGLRTSDKYSPFPEEINRVLATHVADYHFAPTAWAKQNLLKENVPAERIYVTGNTVIDALHFAVAKIKKEAPEIPELPRKLAENNPGRQLVLITGHRRESFGQGFKNICSATGKLAKRFGEVDFVYPVHLNPNVRKPVFELLGGTANVYLIEPLSYLPFVSLMDRAKLILTDSGGIQEEAPSLGKPVLVMRDTTERPEAVEAGTVKLVGTDVDCIVDNASRLLTDGKAYEAMAKSINPYGDGQACGRIIKAIRERL